MKLVPTALPGVVIVEPAVFKDDRGWFMESWNEPRFEAGLRELGLPAPRPFVQDNHSCSSAGVLRGLHYQLPPHPQGKLVRVVHGSAFDVAVDIRRGFTHLRPVGGRGTVGRQPAPAVDPGRLCARVPGAGRTTRTSSTRPPTNTRAIANARCAGTTPTIAVDWPLARVGGTPRVALQGRRGTRSGRPRRRPVRAVGPSGPGRVRAPSRRR